MVPANPGSVPVQNQGGRKNSATRMKAAASEPGQRSMLGYVVPATSKRKPTSATGVNPHHHSTGVNPDQSATGVNPDRSESPATVMSYSLQKAKFFEDTIAWRYLIKTPCQPHQ